MTDLSSKTCLVIDGGLFLALAHRLARDFGCVYFHNPFGSQMPMVTDAVIGDGFSDIECRHDLWQVVRDSNIVVLPDVGHTDLQSKIWLEGRTVWSSGTGDFMELQRAKFRDLQHELGLPVPESETIWGHDRLSAYLADVDECYVKVSKFRGLMETHHWIGMKRDEQWLDALAVKLGPIKNKMPFIVEQGIEAISELGVDTFNHVVPRSRRVALWRSPEVPQELLQRYVQHGLEIRCRHQLSMVTCPIGLLETDLG